MFRFNFRFLGSVRQISDPAAKYPLGAPAVICCFFLWNLFVNNIIRGGLDLASFYQNKEKRFFVNCQEKKAFFYLLLCDYEKPINLITQ